MNKLLLVEDKKILKNGTYEIQTLEKSSMKLDGKVILHSKEDHEKEQELDILDHAHVTFYKVSNVKNDKKLQINIKENASLNLNWLIINEKDTKVELNVNFKKNASKCNLKVRIVNKKDNHIDFICNGHIIKDSKDNELIEDLKGLITSNDSIKISPNMLVDTFEVIANHFVTIGTFNKDDLFYLTTRGLKLETAKKLLVESFMNQVLCEKERNKKRSEVILIA